MLAGVSANRPPNREEQLRHAQKIEAIGRLAGGVAHDFNNMLTAILGYTEMARLDLPKDHPVQSDLEAIQWAARSGAKLAQQLLAFARRQIVQPKVCDLNELILDAKKMLQRLIGDDMELVVALDGGLPPVEVDEGQFVQVLLNLVVNARDAMPAGGRVVVATGETSSPPDTLAGEGLRPGGYAWVSVEDTGAGMTPEVRSKIFEPFFTTKEVGKGTGLGLATCYGIVKQAGGGIEVSSEPGLGSTFRVYLPTVEKTVEKPSQPARPTQAPSGSETVLLVEDHLSVRRIARRMLESAGYAVLEASTGAEALDILDTERGLQAALMITDVIMPQMNGRELADRVKSKRPKLKVLFTSGFMDDAQRFLEPGSHFLAKPFTRESLTKKVRDTLDA
jgi:two-component system, cell cycle sensor histidine kinase and response regulator CckA